MIHRLLLSGPMVRADLAGKKGQTRRPCTPHNTRPDGSPRVKPGDEIWFKETCRETVDGSGLWIYRADGGPNFVGWTPSILCPDEAIRLKPVVTSVRKQKAGEIDEHDARLEGMAGLTLEDLVQWSSRKKVLNAILGEGTTRIRRLEMCVASDMWAQKDALSRFLVAFTLMHGLDALERDVWVYGWDEEVLTEWPSEVLAGRWRYQTGVGAWVCGRFTKDPEVWERGYPLFCDDDGVLFAAGMFETGETFVRLEE